MDRIEVILSIVVAVLTILGYLTGLFGKVWSAIINGVRGDNPYIPRPRKSIVVLPGRQANWWHMGAVDGEPAMQIVAYLLATTITKHPVLLVAARMRKPKRWVVLEDGDARTFTVPRGWLPADVRE